MSQRSKYLIKNTGILAISNFSSKILVFLLVPLYTSVLSTEEYGTYDLAVSTVTLLYPILTANIVDAVMRFTMDKTYSKEEAASIGLKYVLISIVLTGIALLATYWFKLFPQVDGLRRYVFLYYLSYVMYQYFTQLAKGLERVKDMGVAGVISTVIMLGANILLLLVCKMGLSGFFIANILAQAVPVLFYIIRLRFWTMFRQFKRNRHLEKQMLLYCVPLICATIGWWVNSTADKYTVALMCGVAANGLLSVAYKIPSIINTLQGIFIQAWQISAIKEYGGGSSADFYGKGFTYINTAMSVACSVLILLSKPLAKILYANDFYAAWQYVPFLLISSVLNCASGFIGPILSAKKDSKSMALSAIYGAGVNILLNIILVYFMGIQGATIATVVSSYVIYYMRKRAVRNDFQVVEYWKVLAAWRLLCIEAGLEIYTQSRHFEILILFVLLGMNRKLMRETVKRIWRTVQ